MWRTQSLWTPHVLLIFCMQTVGVHPSDRSVLQIIFQDVSRTSVSPLQPPSVLTDDGDWVCCSCNMQYICESCLVVCCYDAYTKEARVGNLSNGFKTRRKDAHVIPQSCLSQHFSNRGCVSGEQQLCSPLQHLNQWEKWWEDRGDSVNELTALYFMKTCWYFYRIKNFCYCTDFIVFFMSVVLWELWSLTHVF